MTDIGLLVQGFPLVVLVPGVYPLEIGVGSRHAERHPATSWSLLAIRLILQLRLKLALSWFFARLRETVRFRVLTRSYVLGSILGF